MFDGNISLNNLEISNFGMTYSDVIFVINSTETYQFVQNLFVLIRHKFIFASKLSKGLNYPGRSN